MKHAIIPLLITCLVVLTSMSDCEKNNLFYSTYDNYVSATIDGTTFESKPEGYFSSHPYYPHSIEYTDPELFIFYSSRDLYSKEYSCLLWIRVVAPRPLELHKRYPVNSIIYDGCKLVSHCYIGMSQDGICSYYDAVSGWIEFTSWDDKKYLSGRFEMDCVNEDNEIIEVRDGIFGPIYTENYYDTKNSDE